MFRKVTVPWGHTVNHQLPTVDTLPVALNDAPVEVVRTQIDSALTAELSVAPVRWTEPEGRSLFNLIGGVVVAALLLVLARRVLLRRGPVTRAPTLPSAPSAEPLTLDTPRAIPSLAQRLPKAILLPPHVVAILQKAQVRPTTDVVVAEEDTPREEKPPVLERPLRSGVDLWIGR